jgi:hypothetical protein
MKPRNPILEELHRVKDAIAKAHDYDMRKLAACLRARRGKDLTKPCPHMPKRASRQRKAS